MRKRSMFSFAGCLLLAGTAATGTAHAAPSGYADCTTTGASGWMSYTEQGTGMFGKFNVSLGVLDQNADGHEVQVRLITTDSDRKRHNWAWHTWYNGAHTGYTWYTTAQSSQGIYSLGVQVARNEGSKLLNSCTAWE